LRRRSDPPAVPATDCRLSSELDCPAVRRFASRFASRLDSPVVPAIPALGLRLKLSSSGCASGQFPACAVPWTPQLPWRIRFQLAPKPVSSGIAVNALIDLRRRLHRLACQRPVSSFRRSLILQPTVRFNLWLAPQTDSSGAPSMRPSACASVLPGAIPRAARPPVRQRGPCGPAGA